MTWDEDTKTFCQWLAENGVVMSPAVAIHDFRGSQQGRGLIANSDISRGDLLFQIPESALLSAYSGSPLKELFAKYDLGDWPELIALMVWAADEPRWKPYFAVLPSKFETPIFWEDLAPLQGSSIVYEVGKAEADELYKTMATGVFCEPAFAGKDTSAAAFHRMGSLIASYAFSVETPSSKTGDESENESNNSDDEYEEDSGYIAMVTPADMLNSHTKKHNARLEMPERLGEPLEMRATKSIKKGEQIYNTYGDLPNRALMRKYGYVEAGGTEYDYADVLRNDICKAAKALKLSGVETKLDKVASKSQEVSEADGAFPIDANGVPSPALLISANWLVAPISFTLKDVLLASYNEELFEKAKVLLVAAIDIALSRYRDSPPAESLPQSESGVYTTKDLMCDQLIASEKAILLSGREWTQGSNVIQIPKRARK